MAKLTRVDQKIFGETGGTGEFGEIGSEAAGSPTTTKDLADIQSLSQYEEGLYAITSNAAEPPRIQDINALYYLVTSQLRYLFQSGIPEWSSDAEYFADVSFVVGSDGGVYQSRTGSDGDPNTDNDPADGDEENWRTVIEPPEVSAYDSNETYDTGDLVERQGYIFSSAIDDNSGNDPLDPTDNASWYIAPSIRDLIHYAKTGRALATEIHPIHDINGSDYVQHLSVSRASLGGTTYEFDLVHLDGTQITGDSDLEAIFDPGGSDEYPFLSLIAEEDMGDWTLKDYAGKFLSAQTSGGERDDIGGIGADQMQRIEGKANNSRIREAYWEKTEGALSIDEEDNRGAILQDDGNTGTRLDFDSADSPDARTSSDTDGQTHPEYASFGIPAIIVMREAS